MNMHLKTAQCLVFFVTALLLVTGYSQDKLLIINDIENPDCILDAVTSITPGGDLRVQVRDEDDCVGAAGAGIAVSNLIANQTAAFPGDFLEFNWISVGAETCSPGGTLPGWSSQTIGLSGPASFAVPTTTTPGTYSASVNCFVGDDSASSNTLSIQVNETQIDPPSAPTLSVSPSAVQEGQTVRVTWQSTNADSCLVPSGLSNGLPGWSGLKSASGFEDIDISGAVNPGSYSVRLQCQNSGGTSQVAQRTVTVQNTTPTACSPNQLPPTSMTRAQQCSQSDVGTSCQDYSSYFGGFPGTTSIRFFVLQRNRYAAMAFTPDEIPSQARLDFGVDGLQTGGIPSGQLIWSISNCPGDFNRSAVIDVMGDSDCFKDGIFANSGFSIGGPGFATSGDGRCGLNLDPGTTYYLNIVYSNDSPQSTSGTDLNWACGASGSTALFCGHQVQPTSINGW